MNANVSLRCLNVGMSGVSKSHVSKCERRLTLRIVYGVRTSFESVSKATMCLGPFALQNLQALRALSSGMFNAVNDLAFTSLSLRV